MNQPTSVKFSFVIHEVIVLTGFSKYMLDYLSREDIFKPVEPEAGRRGLKRQYSYQDVVLLRALHVICTGRGKIRNLREALVAFRQEFGRITPGQRIDRQLVVQGNELCVVSEADSPRQLRNGQLTLSLVVDLEVVSSEINSKVEFDADKGAFALKGEFAAMAEEERLRLWHPIKARRLAASG